MNCSTCGSILAPDARFCPVCGAHVVATQPFTPPAYAVPVGLPYTRVSRHLQVAGILWIVYAFERTISKLIGLMVLHGIFGSHIHGEWQSHWDNMGGFGLSHFWPLIAVSLIFGFILSLITGYALLTRQTWGRIFAIVISILALFHPFLGTALGIYTLWVLAPRLSGAEYDALAFAAHRP